MNNVLEINLFVKTFQIFTILLPPTSPGIPRDTVKPATLFQCLLRFSTSERYI